MKGSFGRTSLCATFIKQHSFVSVHDVAHLYGKAEETGDASFVLMMVWQTAGDAVQLIGGYLSYIYIPSPHPPCPLPPLPHP